MFLRPNREIPSQSCAPAMSATTMMNSTSLSRCSLPRSLRQSGMRMESLKSSRYPSSWFTFAPADHGSAVMQQIRLMGFRQFCEEFESLRSPCLLTDPL